MSEGILFSRLLEGLIYGAPFIEEYWERSMAQSCCPVSLLSVDIKIFEKTVNNRLADHLEKCGPLSGFQYGFRSF